MAFLTLRSPRITHFRCEQRFAKFDSAFQHRLSSVIFKASDVLDHEGLVAATKLLFKTAPGRVLSRRRDVLGCNWPLSTQLQDERDTHDSQAAHQFAAHLGQSAKYMLDTGSRHSNRKVVPFLRIGNSFSRMAAPLNMHTPAGLLQSRFAFNAGVSPVGIEISARVAQVEQLLEDRSVGDGSMRDGDLADQLATLIDAGVQLVAEVILAMLFGPLGVDIPLFPFVWFPPQRHRAFLDRLGLRPLVALDRDLCQ